VAVPARPSFAATLQSSPETKLCYCHGPRCSRGFCRGSRSVHSAGRWDELSSSWVAVSTLETMDADRASSLVDSPAIRARNLPRVVFSVTVAVMKVSRSAPISKKSFPGPTTGRRHRSAIAEQFPHSPNQERQIRREVAPFPRRHPYNPDLQRIR